MNLNVVVFVCIIVHSLTESLSNYKISEKLIKCQLSKGNLESVPDMKCALKKGELWSSSELKRMLGVRRVYFMMDR